MTRSRFHSPSSILLSLFVTTVTVAHKTHHEHTHHDEKNERGLARLLGGRNHAEHFIDTVWGGDVPFFLPASSTYNSTAELWWSLNLTEYYLINNKKDGKPWKYEEDIKMVKSGKIRYKQQSHEPGTWEDVQQGLADGVTIAMHNLQHRHPPIHQLCSELETELEIFLGANSYLTPGGSIGFDPHWDWHDILVIQLEGSKTWTVCEQQSVDIYRFRNGIIDGIYPHGNDDFGVCKEYIFRPGDLFYAPFGTIHYAKANQDDPTTITTQPYSMHLTLALDRQQFTWGQLLQDVAESSTRYYSSKLSSVVASNKKLQRQIPIASLHTISQSLDNADLPSDFLLDLHFQVQQLVTQELDSTPRLQSFLLSQLDNSKTTFEETIDLFRYKMVLGRLKEIRNCTSVNTNDMVDDYDDTLLFRRFPNQRIMMEQFEGETIIVTGRTENEQHRFPNTWENGLRYALGSSYGQSYGTFFTLHDLMLQGKFSRNAAIELLMQLLKTCLLEWTWVEETSRSDGEEEACEVS